MRIETHTSIYKALLRLYPSSTTTEFGGEMQWVFSESLQQTGSASSVWLRELRTLPRNLLHSWMSDVPPGQPSFIEIAALLLAFLGIGSWSSHLITDFGLISAASLTTLLLALLAGGFLSGVLSSHGRRSLRIRGTIAAFSAIAIVLLAIPSFDRGSSSVGMKLPGVETQHFVPSSEAEAETLAASINKGTSARLRVQTSQSSGERLHLVTTRSSGVDGIYGLLSIAMLLLGTRMGWLSSRWRLTIE